MTNPKLFAPANYGFQPCSYHEATPEMIADAAGGCGPGGKGDKYVPDNILGLSVTPSCSIHDWTYHYGETPADKIRADEMFRNNMVRQINAHGGWLKKPRLLIAQGYYLAVHWFGGSAFYANVNEPEEMK